MPTRRTDQRLLIGSNPVLQRCPTQNILLIFCHNPRLLVHCQSAIVFAIVADVLLLNHLVFYQVKSNWKFEDSGQTVANSGQPAWPAAHPLAVLAPPAVSSPSTLVGSVGSVGSVGLQPHIQNGLSMLEQARCLMATFVGKLTFDWFLNRNIIEEERFARASLMERHGGHPLDAGLSCSHTSTIVIWHVHR